MSTTDMRAPWGFTSVAFVGPEGSDMRSRFLAAMNDGARERGIARTDVESDALDMSRDLILSEAAHAVGGEFQVHDETLILYPAGSVFDMDAVREMLR